MGVALGSIEVFPRALVEKDWIKMQNFNQGKNKHRYVYLLTLIGVADKSKLTAKFLKRNVADYEVLQAEIDALKSELEFGACPTKE